MKYRKNLPPLGALCLSLFFLASYTWASPPSPAVQAEFGLGQPASLTDLPPGKLRSRIESLPPAAQQQALKWLQRFSFPTEDFEFIHVDSEGAVLYRDHFDDPAITASNTANQDNTLSDSTAPQTEGVSAVDAFSLHSRPGATRIVYLDFNGHEIQNTAWNNGSTTSLYAQAYDLDGDPYSFNQLELNRIAETWHRIAEDFAPFDIDVTTEDPVNFGPNVGRLLFTRDVDQNGTPMPYQGAGGVAYVGVYGASYYQQYSPALVYYNNLGSGFPAYMAEAASHEFGHNLALSHDGTSTSSYYTGHGSGAVSWGAIMGVGYYSNVTQWSRGEYPGANNTQDDIAIIGSQLGFRFDDHSDSAAGATPLEVTAEGFITVTNPETDPANSQSANKGVIENITDRDFFSFESAAGTISISATPAWSAYYLEGLRGANLDLHIAIYDANNPATPIAVMDPVTDTSASLQIEVTGGSYLLSVMSVGNSVSPYPEYGSRGQYFISGTVVPPAPEVVNTAPVANNDAAVVNEDSQIDIAVLTNDTDDDGDSLTILSVVSATHGTVEINNSVISYTPAKEYNGADNFSYAISDGNGGSAEATVQITVAPVNDAPVANNDSTSLDQGSAITVAVLTNDTDIDDAAANLLVSTVGQAAHGQLQISADQKSITYTPAADYSGNDSFVYTMRDAAGATASATVTITVIANETTPSAPSGVAAIDLLNGTAAISWSDNSSNEDSFQIERQKMHKNGSWVGSTLLAASANSTSFTDASGSGNFRYRVKAVNSVGSSSWSSWSNVVSVAATKKGGGNTKDGTVKGGGKGGKK